MIGYFYVGIGCDDSVGVTDVSDNQNNLVEYPCLSSEDDCANSLDISGGKFNFFSTGCIKLYQILLFF